MLDAVTDVLDSFPSAVATSTTVVVLALTALAFRSLFIPLRLLFTIVLTISLVFGCCVLYYQHIRPANIPEPKLYWLGVPFAVPVLIGLTIDYDMVRPSSRLLSTVDCGLDGPSTH